MANKDRKGKKNRIDAPKGTLDAQWWSEDRDFAGWFSGDGSESFEAEDNYFIPAPPLNNSLKRRLDQIKESHSLIRQFNPRELKILMGLKRNTSPKAWTVREDLMVLTLPLSNRDVAEMLKDRNKEAVKKRLQLLRSKGLIKRQPAAESVEVAH